MPLVSVRGTRALNVHATPPRDAAAPTAFLVHGAGGRADHWRSVAPALVEAGWGVVSYDALGHGDSPAPRQWRAYAGPEFVADLHALVARHGSARNILVGHSYGTRVVLAALCEGLPDVERALLLAPPGLDPSKPPWIAWLPVPVLERMRPKLSAGFRAVAWGPDAPAGLVEEETRVSDRNSLYVFKAMWRQWLALDRATLGRLALPIRILAGEADKLTPPAGAQGLAQCLAQATFDTLPRCGHQIPLEQPQAILRALLHPPQR